MLFLGLESFSQASMTEVRKGFNRVEHYANLIGRVHTHGIAVQAGIVFGFDSDTPAIFKDTLELLEQTGVQNAVFNILTSYPGTPLFEKLDSQGRILTRDWRKYNGRTDVRVSAAAYERGRTPGRIPLCESAVLFAPQHRAAADALAG